MAIDYLIQVTECEPLPGYRLKVKCSDGVSGVFDMSKYLERGMFKRLKDTSVFNAVRLVFARRHGPGILILLRSECVPTWSLPRLKSRRFSSGPPIVAGCFIE